MTGTERREKIIMTIKQSEVPIPAKILAGQFSVSRQVIVQDIALIRAAGYDVISTNRGYILSAPQAVTRTFKVSHTGDQLEDELCTVVDLGGKVVNVMVRHRVYGPMEAALNIRSRKNIRDFLEDIRSGKSSPLMTVTSNYHYHTIEADTEETLDLIQKALEEKGYLLDIYSS